MTMGIRRLAVSLILVVVAATVGVGWLMDRLFDQLGNAQSEPLQAWRQLGRQYADTLLATSSSDSREFDSRFASTEVILLSRDDLALGSSTDADIELTSLLESGAGLALEGVDGLMIYYTSPGMDSVIGIPYKDPTDSTSQYRLYLTMAFYVGLALLILAWLLPLMRRLSVLAATSQHFGKGDFSVRVKTHPRSDIHVVETAFNTMALKIQTLIEDNRLLGRGVAHDLKTPLARLRFGIDSLEEMAEESGVSNPRLTDHVNRLEMDIGSMERLVQALLTYARFETRHANRPFVRLKLQSLIADRIAGLDSMSRQRVQQVKLNDSDSQRDSLTGDEVSLSMMIDNLLQNALRYGNSGVMVSLQPTNHAIVLLVEDDGPGIAPEDHDKVLQPFVRGSNADDTMVSSSEALESFGTVDQRDDRHDKGHDHGHGHGHELGHGLGLALVSRIAEHHGASLTIKRSASLGGAKMMVTFPCLHS